MSNVLRESRTVFVPIRLEAQFVAQAREHALAAFRRQEARAKLLVHQLARKHGLQEADAQDVTQNVLLKLARKLREFSYDPSRSFRAWLKTLTHHAWSDFLESQQRAGLGSGARDLGRTKEREPSRVSLECCSASPS